MSSVMRAKKLNTLGSTRTHGREQVIKVNGTHVKDTKIPSEVISLQNSYGTVVVIVVAVVMMMMVLMVTDIVNVLPLYRHRCRLTATLAPVRGVVVIMIVICRNAAETDTQQSNDTNTASWTQASTSVQLTSTIIAMSIFVFTRDSQNACVDYGRDSKRDGVYRVVQVPLNYTLAHLRKLLIYVFDPAKDNEITVPYNLRRPLNRLSRTLSSDRGKGKELATPSDLIGHLFEVQKRVEIGQDGVIKQGHTWVKSSTTRDPYHYPGNDLQDTLFLDDESDQWRWEAEEDVQLVKVWPKGGDLARAIIYHHDAHTQIHITVNTMKIPPRKGVGNTPFLFLAYGSLSLSNPDGTLRLGTVETTRWNRIGAYDRFLKNEADNDRAANQADDDDSDEDAEGEVDPDVSSATLPIYGLDSSPFVASDSSNPVTPFPAEPSLRRRVDYENRRILKLTKASMKDAGLSDEEDDVDELANDDVDPAWKEKPSDWDPFQDGDEIC
ncbi:hypothetical protein V8B97DRAFT_1918709 [Scleroderma yunnanense]